MAKKHKKTHPQPIKAVGRKDPKDKWRRAIRCMMVAAGVLLLVIALAIPVINNAIALGLEKPLKALPLPEGACLLEVSSVAGKLEGNGNGMQYFAALLIESAWDEAALSSYYASLVPVSSFHTIHVVPYSEIAESHRVVEALPLHNGRGDNRYVVYAPGGGDSPLQGWLDLDLRGH